MKRLPFLDHEPSFGALLGMTILVAVCLGFVLGLASAAIIMGGF